MSPSELLSRSLEVSHNRRYHPVKHNCQTEVPRFPARFPEDVERLLSKPHTKAGKLQRYCYALFLEHVRDGALPTSGRFIFYELEDRGVVPKVYRNADGTPRARTPPQDISDALTHLREVGLIPWDAIVNETRSMVAWEYADSVVEYVAGAAESARIDVWAGEEPPLILCESRSLAGVLQPIAQRYLCPIASTNGQAGGFLHTAVAPLVEWGRRVLYLGDYDLSGGHIEDNTRKVLSEYGDLEWTKVAITGVQVREHGYEADAVEKTDHRYRPPHRFQAVETERLGQVPLTQLLRERLDVELPEPLADVLEREEEQRAQVRNHLSELMPEPYAEPDHGRMPPDVVDGVSHELGLDIWSRVRRVPGVPAAPIDELTEEMKGRIARRWLRGR